MKDISKQSGLGNSPPNPRGGKQMHIYFYRNYIYLKSDKPFNKCLMLLFTVLFFLEEVIFRSKSTTNIVMSFREVLKY